MDSNLYKHLGAHLDTQNGETGVRFAVWAPNATEVSVLCDLNSWMHGRHWLNSSSNGVWWGFVPGMKHGDPYKFGIRTRAGHVIQKSDPYAFACEVPPKSASIVYNLGGHIWRDNEWLSKRASSNWYEQPVSVYEVHLGSWKRPTDGRQFFTYGEIGRMLVDYVKDLGYTHIELMPVNEFPFDGSWGYQATGYFAPTSRFGSPHDFMEFVEIFHAAGIGVIIDWVPAHFPTDGHSLGSFDGTACYEHEDPRKGFHPDWGTLIFNYGRTEVRDFLLSSAKFWMETFHIDGLRVDAVASMLYLDYSRKPGEWVPNMFGGRENLEAIDFLKEMNTELYREFPGILTVAEESTAWGGVSRPVYTGGLGFGMKWDMGWMNDTLRYMRREPVHRKHHQNELSFRMVYAFTENFMLPLSHDEVVHGKCSLLSQMPGDHWQKFANLRTLFGYQYTQPGKKLLFMGGEIGQWLEWNHNTQLDWPLLESPMHAGLHRLVRDLNTLYRNEPALHQLDMSGEGFRWISCDDSQNSVYSYIRQGRAANDRVIVVINFTPVPRYNYKVGVPSAGYYIERINTDSSLYGGSNVGNVGGVYSQPGECHGENQFVSLTLPPLAMLVLKPVTSVGS